MPDITNRLLSDQPLELLSLIREPLTVGESLSALDLMAMFRRARPHVALVVDEYGGLLGIVTPTDVLETITGDFADDSRAGRLVRREDGSWLADGQMELQALGASSAPRIGDGRGVLDARRARLEPLGRIPLPGEVVIVNQWRLEVVDLDGHGSTK
jgi:CBS domain containing-hemolysin-like protein